MFYKFLYHLGKHIIVKNDLKFYVYILVR